MRALVAVLAIGVVGLVPVAAASASAKVSSDRSGAEQLVLTNPSGNMAADPILVGARCTATKRASGTSYQCDTPCANAKAVIAGKSQGLVETLACTNAALAAINRAHAAEHVRPLVLPSDWQSLTVPEQLFVLTDLERVDRGLAPYVGLVPALDADASAGAGTGSDPIYAVSAAVPGPYTANWAGDIVSPLVSDYEFMYTDGWGPVHYNPGCTTPHAVACWDHRDAILGRYTGVSCTSCLMGAAFINSSEAWGTSYAEIFLAPGKQATLVPSFSWARDVVPFLSGGAHR